MIHPFMGTEAPLFEPKYTTRSRRKVSTIGMGRFVITLPRPWVRAIENAFKREIQVMTFQGYTDKAILRPFYGAIVPRASTVSTSVFTRIWKLTPEISVVELPISWLKQYGFDPLKHARSKYREGYPFPRSFYTYISTSPQEICIEPRSEAEKVVDELKDAERDEERKKKFDEMLKKLEDERRLKDVTIDSGEM